jgi:hypothetical protein
MQFQFQGPAATFYNNMVTAIEEQGGTVTGNSSSGTFSIKKDGAYVNGTYSIVGQTLTVTVTSKSLLPTCTEIQEGIEKFISGLS